MGFFDQVKDSVSLVGTGVGQKVNQTADTLKLNNQIRTNDKRIEQLIYEVGKKCVETHLTDENGEYEEFFSQIRKLQKDNADCQWEIKRLSEESDEQIRRKQQEVRERQEQRERQRQEAERQQQDREYQMDEVTKVCKYCQQRNELDAKFCISCGKLMDEEEKE